MTTAYNPLGAFDPKAALLIPALDAARSLKPTLPAFSQNLLRRIYLHWAVAPFGCLFGDYNFMVDLENGEWVIKMTHDPRDNMPGLNNNAVASHTWHRNTGAIGIAIGGMNDATTTDFGPDGVQMHELEFLCATAATIAVTYGLDAGGVVPAPGETHLDNNGNPINTAGEWNIETHATCAMYDDYRDERWDLGCLVPMPAGLSLTDDMRKASAAALRERVHQYALALR